MKKEFERRGRVERNQAKWDREHKRRKSGQYLKSVPEVKFDVEAKYGHLRIKNCHFEGVYPVEVAVAITRDLCPGLDVEEFIINHELYGLDEVYYLPRYLMAAALPFCPTHLAYMDWADSLVAKHEEELLKQEDESYVYYDAEFGYFENEARESLVKTDNQEISKETVTNTNTNTNNTEIKTMSNFKFDRSAQANDDYNDYDSFNDDIDAQAEAYAEANAQAKREDSVADTEQKPATVQVPVQINTNNNTGENTMSDYIMPNSQIAKLRAEKTLADAEVNNVASVVSQPVEIEANPGMPNSTIAKLRAEQAASNEVVETVEDTNHNTNTSIPKTMPKVNVVRQLESIELVINIIAAAGGDIARKPGAVANRTEKLNVLRNKNQNTVSNIRGYGFVRSNSADDSAFMSVNVFPEVAKTIYQTSNRPVVIFNYNDGTSVKQNAEETEIFWRKVLHASDDVVIANLNPTLKFDLDASGDLLRDRIDAGTVQAVSVKFNDLSKMFRFWVGNYNVMSILNLSLVSDYQVSFLRDTVELTEDFLGYKSNSGKLNNFSAFSKTDRKGNGAVVVGQVIPAASAAYNEFVPSSMVQPVVAPQVAAARAVEAPVAAAVVVDAEKEALRVENADLKAKVADLTAQVSNLVAGQARMEAMMAQLVAAQTPVVSIPETVEVVAPAPIVEKSEEEILAEMETARSKFYHSEVTPCGYDERDEDEQAKLKLQLKEMDNAIDLFKELMPIPVAERDAYLANKEAEHQAKLAALRAEGNDCPF